MKKFQNFIFDLDGTTWLWEELVPGADKLFDKLEKEGKNVIFITNNTVLTINGFKRKLKKFGIKADILLNPTIAAIKILKERKVFCIGEGIKKDLRKSGVKVIEKNADTVVVSEDRNVTSRKINIASDIIFNGGDFYKTALGGVWVMNGKKIPGTGAYAKLLEYSTGKEATLIGKPSRYMIDVIKDLKLKSKETVIFGDECNSDIELGNKLGFHTVLVLTGRDNRSTPECLKGISKPDKIIKSIADVIKWI